MPQCRHRNGPQVRPGRHHPFSAVNHEPGDETVTETFLQVLQPGERRPSGGFVATLVVDSSPP